MNNLLLEKTEEWKQLERKTLEQRKEADKFYEDNLMSLICEDYISRNSVKVYEEVKYLVVSVGTSFEPIILNISLFKPEKILFLYTKQSEPILNKVVAYCKLIPEQYEKSCVSEKDPLDIYREIKRSYLMWNKPEKMYIDFTGGTKSMSAAAAMAGALIEVQLVYVASDDYLVDFRKPNPGSENLVYITNPLAVFGDLEIEKALALFKELNYTGAQEKLEVLKESIPDPNIRQQMNFVYLLAKVYEAWDSLDFENAYKYIVILNKQIKRDRIHNDFLLIDFSSQLEKQESILKHLQIIPELQRKDNMKILKTKDTIIALMFSMYQNALAREKQEKYDMSTLLFYRLLEMIEQRRLSYYNLETSNMTYETMIIDEKVLTEYAGLSQAQKVEKLEKNYTKIKKELFGRPGSGAMPLQVSLLEGFIILFALKDPIIYKEGKTDVNYLKIIRSKVFLRNNSIFAHGLGPVKRMDFEKFKSFVEELFIEFCKIEKISFEQYAKDIKYIDPMNSKNYARQMED